MSLLNPFGLTGVEAVITSGMWAVATVFIVNFCMNAAAIMTTSVCNCVTTTAKAWADAYAKRGTLPLPEKKS
jgi:hypothetical protein